MKYSTQQLEFCLLLIATYFISLSHSIYNIALVAYALLWLWNRYHHNTPYRQNKLWNYACLFFIGTNILCDLVIILQKQHVSHIEDVIRYVGFAWLLSCSLFSEKQIKIICLLLIAGTLTSLGIAYIELYMLHKKSVLELMSVGHVNHSAIYLALSFGIVFSAIIGFWKQSNTSIKISLAITLLLLLQGVLISDSRAAIGGVLIATLFISLLLLKINKHIFITTVFFIGLFFASTHIIHYGFITKEIRYQNQGQHYVDAPRLKIWKSAWMSFHMHPLFGLGSGNFKLIDSAYYQKMNQTLYGRNDTKNFMFAPHAHNVYLNKLAETGLVGISGLLFFLGVWLFMLLNYLPNQSTSPMGLFLWTSCSFVFLIDTGIGLFNTTLHHEHALQSMLILGLFLSHAATQKKSATS